MGKGNKSNSTSIQAKSVSVPGVAKPDTKAQEKSTKPKGKKRSEIDDIFSLAETATSTEGGGQEPMNDELKEIAEQIKKAREKKVRLLRCMTGLGPCD
jgi:hypothetical protein